MLHRNSEAIDEAGSAGATVARHQRFIFRVREAYNVTLSLYHAGMVLALLGVKRRRYEPR